MKPAKYRYDNGEICEILISEDPVFEYEKEAYEQKIKSLRRYPAPSWPQSLKGIDLEEGKGFRLGRKELPLSPESGTKVIGAFVNGKIQNGYDHDKERAEKYLKEDQQYTIDYADVGGWHTDFYLQEFPGVSFNSVNFWSPEYIAFPILPDSAEQKSNDMSKKYNGWNDNKSTASGVGGQSAYEHSPVFKMMGWIKPTGKIPVNSCIRYPMGDKFAYFNSSGFSNPELIEGVEYLEQTGKNVYPLTSQQMIEIWDHGFNRGGLASHIEIKQFFKEKFNIDLP